ncbi:MAG: hypothetical protein R2861_14980 [Desulfobacterales bacterium]
MAVRYLTTAEDLALKPGARDSDLGYEFDLWYTYKLNKYVSSNAMPPIWWRAMRLITWLRRTIMKAMIFTRSARAWP